MSILDDLVESIKKSKQQPRPVQRPMPVQRTSQSVVKSGPGGTIFNFSGATGNPLIDSYNQHLNHHADTTQLEIARSQHNEFAKALGDFVDKGQVAFETERMIESSGEGIHGEWNKQLGRSTDQQIIEAFKKGELDCNENQSGPAGGGISSSKFGKSSIKLGGEDIRATSETDAALIEMMKGGHFDEDTQES